MKQTTDLTKIHKFSSTKSNKKEKSFQTFGGQWLIRLYLWCFQEVNVSKIRYHVPKLTSGVLGTPCFNMMILLKLPSVALGTPGCQTFLGGQLSPELNFPGSQLSQEVNYPRKSTFPGSQLSPKVLFPGKSTFPGGQLSRVINFPRKSTFPRCQLSQ